MHLEGVGSGPRAPQPTARVQVLPCHFQLTLTLGMLPNFSVCSLSWDGSSTSHSGCLRSE